MKKEKLSNALIALVRPEASTSTSSSLARRRTATVLGSRRWWQGGCWATRSHQEAYLRRLYARKNEQHTAKGNAEDRNVEVEGRRSELGNTWSQSPQIVYDLPPNCEHYLDDFLKNRNKGDINDLDVDVVDEHEEDVVGVIVGCPALTASRASPTEKCVEYLNGAHDATTTVNFENDRRNDLCTIRKDCRFLEYIRNTHLNHFENIEMLLARLPTLQTVAKHALLDPLTKILILCFHWFIIIITYDGD